MTPRFSSDQKRLNRVRIYHTASVLTGAVTDNLMVHSLWAGAQQTIAAAFSPANSSTLSLLTTVRTNLASVRVSVLSIILQTTFPLRAIAPMTGALPAVL
jgi:hypothetical protein